MSRILTVFLALVLFGCYPNAKQAIRIISPTPELSARAWVAVSPTTRYYQPVAATGSMEPYIHGGDFACFEKYVGQQLYVGDIIDMRYSKDIPDLFHRIVLIDGTRIKTSGDANHNSDAWSDIGQVDGILVKLISLP